MANRVREVDKMVQILFLTNMAQYALKGYEVEAKGYILKPISYFALVMEMKKLSGRLEANPNGVFFLPA